MAINYEWIATTLKGVADFFGLGEAVEELGTSIVEGVDRLGGAEPTQRSYATVEAMINKIYNGVRQQGEEHLAELNKRLEGLIGSTGADNHIRDVLNRTRNKINKEIKSVEKDLQSADSKVNEAKSTASNIDTLSRFSRSTSTGTNSSKVLEDAAKDKATEAANLLNKYNKEGEEKL